MDKLSKSESGRLGGIAHKIKCEIRKQEKIIEYNKSPKLCVNCHRSMEFDKKNNKFCSHSCSGLFTGLGKDLRKTSPAWNCLFCNKEHITKEYKAGKFCNHACQQKFQTENRLSKWKETGVIKNSSGNNPSWLRRYILDKQNYKCFRCGIVDWNNEPLVLELEHKDGNGSNNLEDNLCCLCPNCHSQTPTYKAKNKGNGRPSRRKNL
jgi:hypothetical protein